MAHRLGIGMACAASMACAIGMALAGTAYAQPVTGFYVAASVGPNLVQRESAEQPLPLLDLGAGPAGTFSTGYGLGNGFRFEFEGSIRDNSFDQIKASGMSASVGGDEVKYGAMVNLAYDFNTGVPWLIPYLGVGVGYQWVRWHDLHAGGYPLALDINGTNGVFGYQAFAGLSIPITAIPGLSLTAEYRFLGMSEARKYGATVTGYDPSGGVAMTAHGTIHPQDDFNHSILFGLRYNFDDPNAGNSNPGRPPPVIMPN